MRTLSNVCLLLGVALCLFSVEWASVRFFADANARGDDCYKGFTLVCPGTDVDCPTVRCTKWYPIERKSGERGAYYLKCQTLEEETEKEQVEYQRHEDHHVDVVKNEHGHLGLQTGHDEPCKMTGTCGCDTLPPEDDSELTKWCSSHANLTAGPNEVKVRAVDNSSEGCVGE